MIKRRQKSKEESEYDERVLTIRRVSKKTTGGNYVTFSALVAVGDGKGNVGVGLGRGREVPPAINKGITQAKRRMVHLPIFNDTIPHEIRIKYKSSRLLLKPAPPGSGLKLGGVVRSIMDIAGIQNASGKIIGSRNQITNAYAVIEAIKQLKPRIVKGKTISAEKPQEVSEVKADVVEKPEVIEKPKEVKEPKKEIKKEVKKVTKPTKKVAKKKPTKEKSA